MNERVSVVIPVFNGAPYLAAAIASAMEQSHRPHEVIVVDDGSTDDSAAIAESTGALCLRRDRTGAGAARNTGVEKATGEFLAFLDADDLWLPDKTAQQLNILRDGSVDMVFGLVQQFRERDSAMSAPEAGYVPGTLLIRREQFLRVGPFATQWKVGEFIDWYGRAADMGLRSSMIPQVVLKRRVHDTNTGVRERASQTDYASVVRAALERRRNTGK